MIRQSIRNWADEVLLKSVGQGAILSLFFTTMKYLELDASDNSVSLELRLYLAISPTVLCTAANTITFFSRRDALEIGGGVELEEDMSNANRV